MIYLLHQKALSLELFAKSLLNNINKNINIGLKWPNDLILNKKKIGGILIEKEHYQNTVKTIIGIGINLNIEKRSLGGEIYQNLILKINVMT